ncbi:MAG: leucine-rich repeat protein [Clostridia bacterium]|nr:leucine-rich repeat protein [Clostridia bacterium]
MKKKFWSLLIAVIMIAATVCAFALTASAAEVASGTTGDVSWTLSDDGTLTFSGEGAMADYSNGTQPWYAHKDSIKTVIVTKGVTSISTYAFYEFPELATVKIAGSVTAIGSNAFAMCSNLSNVEYYGSSNPVTGSNVFFGSYIVVKVPSSYSGDVFCETMTKATLDAANEPLPPASPCDHAGHTQTGCTACGATDESIHSFVSGSCSVCGLTCAHDAFDTATGYCGVCGEYAAVASLTTSDDTSVVTHYVKLEDAITAANAAADSTITLRDDAEISAPPTITSSSKVSIKLNGNNVNGVTLYNSGSLTITGNGNYNGRIENRGTMLINANVGGEVEAYGGKLTVIGGTIQSLVVYGDDIVSLKGGTFNELKVIIENRPLSSEVDLANTLYKILAYGKLYSHSDIETGRYTYDPNEGMKIDYNGNIGHAWFTSPVSVLEDDPVIPTISTQPVGADYTMIDTAEALSVTATNNDDGGTLSYQWYSDTDGDAIGGTAITDATGTTYTPPIDVIGTVYYYCVVTNSKTGFDSKSIASSAARVTIVKATLKESDFTLSNLNSVYNFVPQEVEVTLPVGLDAQYVSIKYYQNDNMLVSAPSYAGNYEVRIAVSGSPNHEYAVLTYTMKISPRVITVDQIEIDDVTYNGGEHKPKVIVDLETLPFDVTAYGGVVEYSNNIDTGDATVTITGNFEIEGGSVATFKINPATPNITVSAPLDKVMPGYVMDITGATDAIDNFLYPTTFTVVDGEGYSVSGNTVTIDEGVKIGSTITVKVTSTATNNYTAGEGTLELTIGVPTVDITDIENDIADLEDLINSKADATLISSEIALLQTAISNLKENGATDAELTALENRLNGAVSLVAENLETAKSDLQNAINAKADTATLNTKVEELKDAIETAETVAKTYADTKDTALKQTLEAAILTAKNEAISSAQTLVNNAKTELQTAINAKADTATLNTKVEELKDAIETAETVAKTYADTKDTALKQTLEEAILTAKNEAISSAQTLVNNAKTELQTAINAKADTATLNAKVDELNEAIENIEYVANNYADTKDTALKQTLEEAILTAKNEAISSAQTLVEYAKSQLQKAINTKADATTLNAKVEELSGAIKTAETLAKAYADTQNAELKVKLESAIESSQNTLRAGIDALSSELTNVKQALETKASELEAKDNTLQTVIIVVSVVSGVTFCGCGTLSVFYIIDKKKKH